jgi:hypothetical protein
MRLPLLDAPALALHLLLDAQLLEQLGLAAGAAGAGRVGDRGRREQLALEGVDRADAGLGRAAAHRHRARTKGLCLDNLSTSGLFFVCPFH